MEMAGGLGAKHHPDALPPHAAPSDVRASYATDTTAVGDGGVAHSKYGHTAMPATGDYQRTHQTYNQNTSGTF